MDKSSVKNTAGFDMVDAEILIKKLEIYGFNKLSFKCLYEAPQVVVVVVVLFFWRE